MSGNPAGALREALVLTEAMRDAALRDDWQAMATLDAKRRDLLVQGCAQSDVDTAGLAMLHERNEMLIALVQARRTHLVGEWRDSRDGQRALQKYQNVARNQGA